MARQRLPMVEFDVLWHVGEFSGRRSVHASHEGSGLSVSEHPEEWREIARLRGPTWEVRRRDGKPMRLVDMLALVPRQRRSLARGLVALKTRWVVSWVDAETDEERYLVAPTHESAVDEAHGADGAVIRRTAYPVATPALESLWADRFDGPLDDLMAEEFAIVTRLEERGFDGAWWDEELDPDALSAPRGVVFQAAIESRDFTITRVR